MDKFKYIICLSFLMIFLSSFDDYNESGKVFFNYGVSETNYKSYYTNAYMSTESVYPNGMYLYFYFIDNAAKKSGVMQINLATAYDTVMYLPCNDAKVYYFEKTKGSITYKSEDVTGSIVLDTEAVGSEITSLSIKFNLNINTNGVTDYIFYKGYASSTSVDKEYRDDNTNNNNNSVTTTTSAGCGEDPYEDTEDEDDSSCSGSPSNSGVEDDNSTSSCSDEPQDETDDTTSSCDSGDSSSTGDDEDTSCDSGDTNDDTSETTDSSCSSDSDTGDDSSGDCSGDEVEAANTFTKKKQKKNMKKMINFFMPVFFISVFVFTLKKRKKYL